MFRALILAFALLAPVAASAKGKPRKPPKEDKPPVTILDMSEPEAPAKPTPDIVEKGKL